jgi:hypothetical protein
MIFKGDFETLMQLGYHTDVYCTYFFKTVTRWGGIFIDVKTREITVEGVSIDDPIVRQELGKIKEYID